MEKERMTRKIDSEEQRKAFEDWIAQSPFDRNIRRWPMNDNRHAWPGQYCHYEVQLAWEAWQAGQAMIEEQRKESA
jgi:hypothetical protein